MTKRLNITIAAAALSIGLAGPAHAQTAAAPAANPAPASGAAGTATGAAAGAAAGASGLANAYSFQAPSLGTSGCCGRYYDYSHANANTVQVISNTNQKLAAVQLAIIEAMRLSTGQLSGNLREQTGAGHTLADQQDDRSTVKSVEAARLEAIRQATSGTGSCRVITGSRGGGGTPQENQFRYALAKELADFYRGETGPAARGQDVAMQARVDIHCAYATPADVAAGVCKSSDVKLPGADLDAAQTLFYRNNNTSAVWEKDRLEAAKAFALHTVAAKPAEKLAPGEGTTAAGRIKAAERQTSVARMSVAQETVSDFIARRTAINDGDKPDGKVVSWAKGMAAKMTGYDPHAYDNGVSQRDWLEIYSRSFLLSPDFLLNSDIDQVTATKDIKNMMAVQLYQGFESYQMLERINMNLAMQLSILTEQSQNRAPRT